MTSPTAVKFSIIIPCFNEGDNITVFYWAIKPVLLRLNESYELIFIDDGSNDNTFNNISNIKIIDEHIKAIRFSRNFGKESAMLAGLEKARGEFVAILDCDLQDPPELLLSMYERFKIKPSLKIVSARRINTNDSFIRSFLTKQFYRIYNSISEVKIVQGMRDFRLMRMEAVKEILRLREFHRFSKAIFEWIGFEKEIIEFNYIPSTRKDSTWNFLKLFKYALGGISSFSTLPLKVSSFLGIIICALSALYGIYTILDKLFFGNPVRGYTTLAILILFFGGLQLVVLGIIGEYIAKIFEQSKNRPHYIIEKEI